MADLSDSSNLSPDADDDSNAPSISSMPSYLTAADNHNLASGNDSWLDEAKGVLGAGAGIYAGAVIGQAAIPIPLVGATIGAVGGAIAGYKTAQSNGKFLAASVISGASSFYNTGVELNNWVGGSATPVDPTDWMQSLDSDLAQYYSQNRTAADVTGFVAGSLLPMGAATKIYEYGAAALNAAKVGRLGANFSEATGLLIPAQRAYLQAAVKELSGQSVFDINNVNVLKAFAAGVGEQAIQGAIQSTAVLATMHASPIVSNMDASDMGWNILEGALTQGLLGGVLEAAKSYGAVYRGVLEAKQAASPFTYVAELRGEAQPVYKVLNWLDQKFNMPEVNATDPNAAFQQTKADATNRMLDDRVRTAFGELAKGDTGISNGLADVSSTMGDTETAASNLLGLTEAARINTVTQTERAIAQATKRLGQGAGTIEDQALVQNTNIRYMQIHGEGMGNLTDAPPVNATLPDMLKSGNTIEVKAGSVVAGKQRWNFNTKASNQWDPVTADTRETLARQIWAMHPDGAKLAQDSEVAFTDLPLIDKAVREGIPVKIRNGDGSVTQSLSGDQLGNVQKSAKGSFITRVKNASEDLQKVSDPIAVEQKLKQSLGMHFSLSNKESGAIAWTSKGNAGISEPIFLNPDAVKSGRYSIADLAFSLKHEEGHNSWNIIQSMYPGITHDTINEAMYPGLRSEMVRMSKLARPYIWKMDGSAPAGHGMTINQYRERATELAGDSFGWLALHPQDAKKFPKFSNTEKGFGGFIKPVNQDIIDALKLKARKLSNNEIAQLANVRVGAMEGTSVNLQTPMHDIDAMYGDAKEYTDAMREQGRWTSQNLIPTYMQPSVAKMVIDTTPVRDLNGNVLEGMAVIKQQQRLAQDNANRAVAGVTKQLYDQMQEFGARDMAMAGPQGPGQGVFKSANGTYGSVGSMVQQIGATANRIIKAFTDATTSRLNSALFGLKSDDDAALEWSRLSNQLRGTRETYYYDEGNQAFVLRRIKINEELMAAGKKPQLADVLDPNAPETIPVENQKTHDMIVAHMDRNGSRVSDKNALAASNGVDSRLDPRAFYPPPVNPKRYPHFAFVVDPTVNETGHVHMIYAADEAGLDAQIQDVKRNSGTTKFEVITKAEVERYHKAIGDYSRDDTISENYIRNEMLRTGTSSNFIPPTNPGKIADELLNFHLEKDRELARYAITTKYSKEFAELKTQGESYTNLATSKVGSSSLQKWAENQVSNPYADYIKTALDITNLNEIPRWTAVNNYLDQGFTKVWNTVSSMWRGTNSAADIDKINMEFAKSGIKTAYFDSATAAHSNAVASSGALTKFISRANGVMATLLLRMDPLNAANNAFGSMILTGSELQSVLSKIKAGSPEFKEWQNLATINTPGTGDSIFSPTKLYASSVARFFKDPTAVRWAIDNGFASRHIMEVDSLLATTAMTGKETDLELASKAEQMYAKFMRMGDFFEKLTGNKLAEQFNRFVSADMMKQITDIPVRAGTLSKENALSYINTFVNRTQGNYLASQRPLMFQGPVGSAIGLFQTYQFNMAQQLLRHVAEGNSKDAALAMGLQTAIYGMNGLPGFQQINAHIVGNSSGNQNHRDLYDATYGTAGKDLGDWLMYGTASNMLGFLSPQLKTNLYSRGDINPQHPTVIPTSLSEVPIVSGMAKMFTSIKDGIGKMANGADAWPTFLQAIEHSGINRPLAGLAQTLEALGNPRAQSYSTSTKGNVIAANDLFSLANLTRITGGKPLDEAIALDAGYRLDAYKSQDTEARERLGQAIKTTVLGGGMPSNDQITQFASNYAISGGKQEGFNQFFVNTMKKANTSQVNAIVDNLKSPYAVSMQRILGGYQLNDFNN